MNTNENTFNEVMAAVSNKGLALQFASEELRADREIVMAAVKKKCLGIKVCK